MEPWAVWREQLAMMGMSRVAVWSVVIIAVAVLAIRYFWDEHRALTVGTVAGIPTLWWAAIWGCPA